MDTLRSLIFPYGAILAVLAFAAWYFGAATPLACFTLSGILLVIGAAGIGALPADSLPRSALLALGLLVLFLAGDGLAGRLTGGMPDYAALAAAGAIFLCARAAALVPGRVSTAWSMLTVAYLVLALWSFADFIVHPDTIHGQPRSFHTARLSGGFLSANTAATLFGTGALIAATGLLRALKRAVGGSLGAIVEGLFRHGALSLICFLFCGICLVLTASRAGIAFATLSLVLLLTWEMSTLARGRLGTGFGHPAMLAVLAALAVVAVLVFSLSGDLVAERYGELGKDTGERAEMFRAYWQASQERPLFGHGFGAFDRASRMQMTADNADVLIVPGAAHNVFLQWLMQRGWFGALAMWGVIASILWRVGQGLARRQRQRGYLRGVLVIALFVILHGTVDYALEIPGFMWWWALILGLGAGVAAGGSRQQA